MLKKIAILSLTCVILPLANCASIISKSQYPVSIQSSPSEISFTVTDSKGVVVHTGRTPMSVTLDSSNGYFKGAKYTVEYAFAGGTKTTTISPTVDGWFFGNILFGGRIGMLIVDPLTGAMYKLPEVASVSADADTAALPHEFKVASINELSEEEKQRLIPIK